MKRLFAAVAMLGLTLSAFAQDLPDYSPVDFTFRAGMAIPLDEDLIDSTPVAFTLGVDYNLEFSFMDDGNTFISWDYVHTTDRIQVLSFSQRLFTGRRDSLRGESYFFLGIGGSWTGGIQLEDAAFAVRGGLGFELSHRIVLEVIGVFGQDQADRNPSHVSLTVGYRY